MADFLSRWFGTGMGDLRCVPGSKKITNCYSETQRIKSNLKITIPNNRDQNQQWRTGLFLHRELPGTASKAITKSLSRTIGTKISNTAVNYLRFFVSKTHNT